MTSAKPLDISSIISDPNAKSFHTYVPYKANPDSLVVMASTSGAGGQKFESQCRKAVGLVLIWPVGELPAS